MSSPTDTGDQVPHEPGPGGTATYGGYLMAPQVWPSVSGGYHASVAIIRQDGARASGQILNVTGVFAGRDEAEQAAIEHAKVAIAGGIRWLTT